MCTSGQTDTRKPHHHRRFSGRNDLLSAPWQRQGVSRIGDGVHPALGFQLMHKATCRGGGCLTRHSHYLRLRLGGVTIWRIQCTTCKAVFTVLPHFVLRIAR